jgi:hypothetical protein
MSSIVRVDIDIPYSVFMRLFRKPYEKAVNLIAGELGLRVESIRYYESQHGNTHIYITLDKKLNKYDYIVLQFLFYNDGKKTFHNLRRLIGLGDPVDLMFHFIKDSAVVNHGK